MYVNNCEQFFFFIAKKIFEQLLMIRFLEPRYHTNCDVGLTIVINDNKPTIVCTEFQNFSNFLSMIFQVQNN